MTSVEADSYSILVFDLINDLPYLSEITSNGMTLFRHVLKDNFDRLRLLKSKVDILCNEGDAFVPTDLPARRSCVQR